MYLICVSYSLLVPASVHFYCVVFFFFDGCEGWLAESGYLGGRAQSANGRDPRSSSPSQQRQTSPVPAYYAPPPGREEEEEDAQIRCALVAKKKESRALRRTRIVGEM